MSATWNNSRTVTFQKTHISSMWVYPAENTKQLWGYLGYQLVTQLLNVSESTLQPRHLVFADQRSAVQRQMFPCAPTWLDMHRYFQDRKGCNLKLTFNENVFVSKKKITNYCVLFAIRSAFLGCHKKLSASLLPTTVMLNLKDQRQNWKQCKKSLKSRPNGENEVSQLRPVHK